MKALKLKFYKINTYKYKNILSIFKIYCNNDFLLKNFYIKIFIKKILYLLIKKNPINYKNLLKTKIKNKNINYFKNILKTKTKENLLINNFLLIKSKEKIKSYLYDSKIISIIIYNGVENKKIIKDLMLHIIFKKIKFIKLNHLKFNFLITIKKIFYKKNIEKNLYLENIFLKHLKKYIFYNQNFIKNKNLKIKFLINKYNIFIKKIIIIK